MQPIESGEEACKTPEIGLATLVDLPTELVLQILHDERISHRDLYLIGLVARRLNFIAISLLLELRGLSNLHDSVSLTLGHDSLPPLYESSTVGMTRFRRSQTNVISQWTSLKSEALIMVAFHVSSIREVTCTFPQSFTDSYDLLRHLQRLHEFVQRLTNIGSLTLHFEGDYQTRHLSSNMFSAIPVPFAEVFGKIIRAATSRGCKSLRVYNKSLRLKDQYWNLIDDSSSPPIHCLPAPVHIIKKKASTLNILTKAKVKLFGHRNRSVESPKLMNTPSPYLAYDPSMNGQRGNLRAIHIQTPFALLPRCFPSICDIIYSSMGTLTSLTLSYISFDELLFDSFLSALSSVFRDRRNVVTHLDLQQCQKIPPKALLELLRCFQDLEHLELDRCLPFIGNEVDLPATSFQFAELRTVKAPLDWITYFMNQGPIASPLPAVSTMIIQCRLPNAPEFTYEVYRPHLDIVLEPIYSRWKNSSYNYQLPKVEVTLDLFLNRHRPQQMEADRIIINLQSTLLAMSNKDTVSSGSILSPQRPSPPGRPRPPRHWDMITKLELFPTYPPVNDTKAFTLSQWVTTLFPCVEQVTIPIPYIPRHMPPDEYKSRQIDLAVDASVYLKNSLCLRQMSDDSEPIVWKTLVVGPWSLSLELD